MYAEAKRRIPPLNRATNKLSSNLDVLKENSQCAMSQARDISRDVYNNDEVKEMRRSFWKFMESVGVVGKIGFMKGLERVEDYVGVEISKGEGEGEGEGAEVEGEDVKAKGVMWRVGRVLGKGRDKVETSLGERQRKVQGSWEEKLYMGIRYLMAVILAVVSMLVDATKKYNGPGKQVVGDVAETVQMIIPTTSSDFSAAETVGVLPGSPESSDNGMATPPSSPPSDEHTKME